MDKLTNYERNINWRKKHPDDWKASKKRYYDKHSYSPNGWRRWTPEEIRMCLDHSISDVELSKRIGKSVRAIQVKRHNLKKEI